MASQPQSTDSWPTMPKPTYYTTFLDSYLPVLPERESFQQPFVTLTYAQSLDSSIALAPGLQTKLSGPLTKQLTHHLRSKHDGILIGIGTALADDPSLNCRIEGVGLEEQPTPIILDPRGRWPCDHDCKLFKAVRDGVGKGPLIIRGSSEIDTWTEARIAIEKEKTNVLRAHRGSFVWIHSFGGRMPWSDILSELAARGIKSVMVEGGGDVINDLLKERNSRYVGSVIITIAPTFLGKGGVVVSPDRKADEAGRPQPVARLKGVKWQPLGEDVVVCGKLDI